MSSNAETQVAVIAEAVSALEADGIACWLAGGWAVDFLVGRVTRPHRDIDIVIWSGDAERATAALARAGFGESTSTGNELIHFEHMRVPITLSFIERETDGTLVTPGKWRDWPWPADALTGPPGRIGNLAVPIVSLASQLETKENYASHPHGGPLRPQDHADLAVLHAFRDDQR